MPQGIALPPALTDDKIGRLINKAAKMLTEQLAKVGSEVNFMINGSEVKTTLWGFHSSRERMVVELQLNKIVIDKFELNSRGGTDYVMLGKTNHRFRYNLSAGLHLSGK